MHHRDREIKIQRHMCEHIKILKSLSLPYALTKVQARLSQTLPISNTCSLLRQGETEVCCVYFSQRFNISVTTLHSGWTRRVTVKQSLNSSCSNKWYYWTWMKSIVVLTKFVTSLQEIWSRTGRQGWWHKLKIVWKLNTSPVLFF